jgi:S-DNA-T family DNA segregation ATPase FtsK/SpoIIIE
LFSSIQKSRTDSFNKIERHYLAKLPDTEDAILSRQRQSSQYAELCVEMDNRYSLLKDAMVRILKNTMISLRPAKILKMDNFTVHYLSVDFADLIMTAGEVEVPIARLAQLARAIGIHLIIAKTIRKCLQV